VTLPEEPTPLDLAPVPEQRVAEDLQELAAGTEAEEAVATAAAALDEVTEGSGEAEGEKS
jgi:hypothetical protein